ncbi:MAG: class I SAM-dependent methyltransferase [Caldilineaceae bacterium]
MTNSSSIQSNAAPDRLSIHSDQQTLTRYYQFHAKIYDATRWSFLFGRAALIDALRSRCRARRILEVGCGTGRNLCALTQAFPEAEITGIDLSPDMLAIAKKNLAPFQDRVQLRCEAYGSASVQVPRYDLILFSYALSMFNPGWEAAIADAHADLFPGGTMAVADFHLTTIPPFARWMATNHVRMNGHLLPKLRSHFSPAACDISPAYGGLWHYFLFIGRK